MQVNANNPLLAAGGAQKTQAPTGFFATAPAEQTGARKEFSDFMKKSPAEQMRDQILKSMGLDEEKLKAMPAEQRKAIEDKIKEMIKTKIEQAEKEKKGVFVDIKA